MRDDIVCMYACPSTPWRDEPLIPPAIIDPTKPIEPITPWPPITTIPIPQKDMNYYKQEFIRLFKEMESLFGICKSVKIEREHNDDVKADISF